MQAKSKETQKYLDAQKEIRHLSKRQKDVNGKMQNDAIELKCVGTSIQCLNEVKEEIGDNGAIDRKLAELQSELARIQNAIDEEIEETTQIKNKLRKLQKL